MNLAELAERMRKKLKEEYGINSDEELLEAVRNHEAVDLGIFVSPYRGSGNAKTA